jgi:glucosamine 6-phosphate synthetase-like amidotransferase/phosphosugar isomerase protein
VIETKNFKNSGLKSSQAKSKNFLEVNELQEIAVCHRKTFGSQVLWYVFIALKLLSPQRGDHTT